MADLSLRGNSRRIGVVLGTCFLLYAFSGTPITEARVCSDSFGSDKEEDLRKIASYQFPGIDNYLKFIFPFYQEHSQPWGLQHVFDSHETVPVIVTGADFSHFKESLNLIRNMTQVREAYKDMKLIYFDLGLDPHQRDHLKRTCNCDVRLFPFEKLPPHVKILKGYAWKPVCLQIVLNEYRFAMWMDTSVRLKTSNLTWLFKKVKQQGVMAGEGYHYIAERTKETTFRVLGEQPCLYRTSEFEGTFIVVYRSQFVETFFMRPWVSCALTMGCMMPDNHPKIHLYCGLWERFYHECHRFDQSVLSILLLRLYHESIEEHKMKRHTFYEFCTESEQWRLLPEFINAFRSKLLTKCRHG